MASRSPASSEGPAEGPGDRAARRPFGLFPPPSPLDLETSLGVRVHAALWDGWHSLCGVSDVVGRRAGSLSRVCCARTAMPISRRLRGKGPRPRLRSEDGCGAAAAWG